MSRSRNEVVSYINEYLKVAQIEDLSYNGLQVEGKDTISKIGFAVDAGLEVFDKAKAQNCDMIIVHHGLFWEGTDPRFTATNKKRLQTLIEKDINLYGVHLPLDMHEEVGNNVELLRIIGAKKTSGFLKYHNNFIGAVGNIENNTTKVSDIAEILEKKLNTKVSVLGGDRKVSVVAAASGGIGLDAVSEAANLGANLLIVGEKRDFYHLANDLCVSVIFVGHHASEQTGIWALQKHISAKFSDVECVYIDCPTGL